jgi:hypothetical protein
VETYYLLAGLLGMATPGTLSPVVRDPQLEVAFISAVALGYGLAFALVAGLTHHRSWPWLLLGFGAGASLGCVGAFLLLMPFVIWLFARMPVRSLTPDEIAAVEEGPGAIRQSWYVHGRGYWVYRLFFIFGIGILLLLAASISGALAIELATPHASRYPPFWPYDSLAEELSRRWMVISIFVALNAWSGWGAWRYSREKVRTAREAPLDIPVWLWHQQLRLSQGGLMGSLERRWDSYMADRSPFEPAVYDLGRFVGGIELVVALVIAPGMVGFLAVSLFLYGRRQLPLELVWRERTEARLKALAEREAEAEARTGPEPDPAWAPRHRRGRRNR